VTVTAFSLLMRIGFRLEVQNPSSVFRAGYSLWYVVTRSSGTQNDLSTCKATAVARKMARKRYVGRKRRHSRALPCLSDSKISHTQHANTLMRKSFNRRRLQPSCREKTRLQHQRQEPSSSRSREYLRCASGCLYRAPWPRMRLRKSLWG
jgi:hypothetical protein